MTVVGLTKTQCNKNLEIFLNSVELIIPWEDISLAKLENLLEEIENERGLPPNKAEAKYNFVSYTVASFT